MVSCRLPNDQGGEVILGTQERNAAAALSFTVYLLVQKGPHILLRHLPLKAAYTYNRSSPIADLIMTPQAMMRISTAPSKAATNITTSIRRSTVSSQQRSFLTSSRTIPRSSSFPRAALQQQFRRSYADTISPVIKRRGRGFFRWTWRLTYLSAVAGTGYLAYNIYTLRSPQEQFDPDPSKRTLVILGRSSVPHSMAPY